MSKDMINFDEKLNVDIAVGMRLCNSIKRLIVDEVAKSAPTSTIFIYVLGSKALGSSLTSQIIAGKRYKL
jgi:hypothetical protein